MSIIQNEITINANLESIWKILTDLELLDQFDPTVKESKLITNGKIGIGEKRRVTMLDGKNWFEEEIVQFEPGVALRYKLTDCSFPIKGLQHSYKFETIGEQTRVKQVMEYAVKFGIFGKLLDSLVIRKQFDAGIKKFFSGLKSFSESS